MTSDRQKENLRTKHIPDRMLELHVCAKLIEAFEKLDRKERALLELRKKRYEVLPGRALLYCAIDTGIVMCRVLLNFLGVYFDRHGTPHPIKEKCAPKFPSSGDVWVENFSGLHAITLAHAIPAVTKIPYDDAMKALGKTLKAADKALAHLTVNPAGSTVTRQEVKLTCEITIALLNKYFYGAQGDTPIAFDGNDAYAIVREIAA